MVKLFQVISKLWATVHMQIFENISILYNIQLFHYSVKLYLFIYFFDHLQLLAF